MSYLEIGLIVALVIVIALWVQASLSSYRWFIRYHLAYEEALRVLLKRDME